MATTLESPAVQDVAIEAAIWSTPIVSFDAMRQAFFRDAGAKYGDVVYLSRFADWRFQVTTPNASTRYIYLNFNTKDGPVVLEIPPAIGAGLFGSILDAWQVPLADVGPQGFDQGNGGKYLLLPPGHKGPTPAGYIPVQAGTYNGYAVFRAISEDSSQPAIERALGLIKQLKIYPLANAGNPPPTKAIDMAGKLFDGIMRYDESFYTSLARMIDEEPAQPRDAEMLQSLKSLGIEKGKPFKPDSALQNELRAAAQDTLARLVKREPSEGEKFWPNASWKAPSTVGAKTGFSFVTASGLDAEARAQMFFMACAPPKMLGKATMYLTACSDSAARPLTGDRSYRLRLPANVPAEQFWALTVYDAESCAFIRNSAKVEVNSYHKGLKTNADGSIELHLSAEAPAGKEANWIALSPGRPWFAILRFYGPKPALFEKGWQAPDFEEVAAANPGVSVQTVTSTAGRAPSPDGHGWIGTETVSSRLGEFAFQNGYPVPDTAHRLRDALAFNRAVEAYLVQMHGVSWYHVWKGIAEAGSGAPNQMVIWETLMDSSTLLLTGNTETVYGLCSLDLKRDGPVVIEVPPTMLGGINDLWQRAIADIGLTGVDKGKGGKFLVLPPDHGGPAPDGYFAVKSSTFAVSLGLRGFQVNGKADQAVALMKGCKVYALARAANPPAMTFVNGSHQEIDTIFSDNSQFFDDLSSMVDREPHDAIPSHERFQVAAIGIEKGKPFRPDAERRKLLDEAARFASAIARVNSFASDDEARLVYPDRVWEWAFIGGSAAWDSQGYVNTDRRAAFAYIAIGMSPAMVEKHVGAGSQYLWTPRDANGSFLDGGKNYRLHIPTNIPVKNFWSVVAYDSDSRSILRNDQAFPSVSSYTGPQANPDGSIDVYFGPKPQAGKERNWIQTTPGKGWFTLFRFYGPLQPFFDKTWKPDDIVELK